MCNQYKPDPASELYRVSAAHEANLLKSIRNKLVPDDDERTAVREWFIKGYTFSEWPKLKPPPEEN